jgi:hypothetical protein
MKAKEMFKNLGFNYKKTMLDNDSYFIKYTKRDDYGDFYNITFLIKYKMFSASYSYLDQSYDLGVDELKAVIQQTKELGWI